MFGHDTKDENQNNSSSTPAMQSGVPSTGAITDDQGNDSSNTPPTAPASLPPVDQLYPHSNADTSAPAAPADNGAISSNSYMLSDNDAKAPHGTVPADNDALLDIKRDALSQLSPLVSHLEQTPEEKFRTTMMMIQATDDQSLVKSAYEAAKDIPDEKAKAQALLDIVNEINYFTQHQGE